jgi:hypothetical protein
MYNTAKVSLFILIFGLFSSAAFAQEALLSETEQYYDFLAVQGLTERPYLNYRTLSDSAWQLDEEAAHPWQGQNLGTKRKLFGDAVMRIYGPELFASANTAVPHGQNDGALWQGRGFNASFTAGIRFEGYGVEATLKPQLAFSQNASFTFMPPNSRYSSAYYDGKASVYGDYGVPPIDVPQRFGSDPFFTYDWGDSEIRYTWKTLTAGFGTQSIWLGPARINPIIHSNNAPSYPKLDIGMRKQPVTIPWVGWYIGEMELRAWWGYLSESDYFDTDSSNDHNLITGFTFAWAPPGFLKGFTFALNRIMLSKWEDMDAKSIFTLLWPFMEPSAGDDRRDQRASFVFSYLFPSIGFEIYIEWARNDYSPSVQANIRYPFHTQAFTFGARKLFLFNPGLQGELTLELTNTEATREYITSNNQTTFYFHHIITQGHTNRGQWLGAGLGTGGNSQYLGFKLFYPKGYGNFFVQRENIENDSQWFSTTGNKLSDAKALLSVGVENYFRFHKFFGLYSGITYSEIFNPLHHIDDVAQSRNFYFALGVKFIY